MMQYEESLMALLHKSLIEGVGPIPEINHAMQNEINDIECSSNISGDAVLMEA